MKMNWTLSLVAGCSLVAGTACAQTLLVVNQEDRTLSMVDPVEGKQVAVMPVGGVTGHEVAVLPDGVTALVPIYSDVGVGHPGTNGNTISVIDLPTRTITGTITFPHGVRPHCAVYDRNSGMLYVTTELDQAVSIIDPKTMKVVGSVPTGQEQSHMLVLSADGRRGYTANVGPGTVSVLDMVGRKTIAVIPISGNTQRISISRDGSMVFTADQTKPQLAVIDTATNKVKTWIALPHVGYGTASTLDGRWLVVVMRDNKGVAVVDLKTLKVARTIDLPGRPTEVLMSRDGKTAYVSCFSGRQVAAIDVADWKVAKLIDVGGEADGMAWAR